jgi:hypothetical protein
MAVSPQFDLRAFRLMTNDDFRALTLTQRIAYLKLAIEARKSIDGQFEQMLFGLSDGNHD